MIKTALIYFVVIVVFGLGIYATLEAGSRMIPVASSNGSGSSIPATTQTQNPEGHPLGQSLLANLVQPLSLLLLQIIVITLAARGTGTLFTKLGQPAVVGEVFAGILLGPSLLGWLAPPVTGFLFPASSLGILHVLSQVGVILFMFGVGLELNLDSLRHQAHSAILISHVGILAPFSLGVVLSLGIYQWVAPNGVPFHAFALFMGIAMSITAFPVLARILEQRGLAGSKLGSLVIACAAADDVTAWCLLAVVLSLAQSQGLIESALTIGLTLAFMGMMLFLARPGLLHLLQHPQRTEAGNKNLIAALLLMAFTSALFTETIGIHALFGAFLAGVILPPPQILRVPLREHLETFTAFLLPLFFAFTGLRTQIGLLNDWPDWLLCLGIIAVAIAGKLGGAALAARSTGLSWYESLSIGALMNTRGLMELIVINIGYDLGILSARVFVMMVLMALTTTIMAGPILSGLKRWERRRALQVSENKLTV